MIHDKGYLRAVLDADHGRSSRVAHPFSLQPGLFLQVELNALLAVFVQITGCLARRWAAFSG